MAATRHLAAIAAMLAAAHTECLDELDLMQRQLFRLGEPTKQDTAKEVAGQLAREINSSHVAAASTKSWPGKQVNQSADNITEAEEKSLFVHADYKTVTDKDKLGRNATIVGPVGLNLEVAATNEILSVYLLLYVPLLMAWAWYWALCQRQAEHLDHFYSLLIQLSSLCILTRAPVALTLVQGLALLLLPLLACAWKRPALSRDSLLGLAQWLPCSLTYALYQIADHFLSDRASISERVIFGNLVPVFSFLAEVSLPTTFDSGHGSTPSLSAKMSLFSTVFGATIFVLEDPILTTIGIWTCLICNLILVIYRLLQRRTLVKQNSSVSVLWLMVLDGLMLCLASSFFLDDADKAFFRGWRVWLSSSEVVLLLVMSAILFAVGHLVTVLCLKSNSATLTVVVCNISVTICLVQGILFFNDTDLETPLAIIGMIINFGGGLWYALCQDASSHTSSGEDAKAIA
ncbi:unnamed protein product [Effrenium voratum]|nr:unnamed protein product [Effrenium voratum]